jgi:hypothetical protein
MLSSEERKRLRKQRKQRTAQERERVRRNEASRARARASEAARSERRAERSERRRVERERLKGEREAQKAVQSFAEILACPEARKRLRKVERRARSEKPDSDDVAATLELALLRRLA